MTLLDHPRFTQSELNRLSAETIDSVMTPVAAQTAAEPRGPVVLEARDLAVDRGGRRILEGINIEVRAGELLAVVGPNGAGKTTLLGALAGDLAAESGTVDMDGKSIQEIHVGDLARKRAVLLQEQGISFPFTVDQVVRMGRAPWRGTEYCEQDDEVVGAAVSFTEIEHLLARTFPTLSGGEKARASFARVLAQGTGVLFLDEPTAALDIRHQEGVLRLARRLARAGSAVIVVLHDLSLAGAYADRIAIVAEGAIAADGKPTSVLTPELLSQVYGHPIEVIRHPSRDEVIVIPHRAQEPSHV